MENTFDIPAVKFCIISKHSSKNDFIAMCEHYLGYGDMVLIPFETVDGLMIEEALKALKTKDFVLVAIADLEALVGNQRKVSSLLYEVFEDDFLEPLMKERIDKVIEKRFEEKYGQALENEKRIYHSFFERYQDGSYEKTKERVKRLEMRK